MQDPLFDIDNRVVLVTGASSGIGLHLCSMLLARGCRVIGASRTACDSDALATLDKQYVGKFLAVNIKFWQFFRCSMLGLFKGIPSNKSMNIFQALH